ncbi:hypothetical protein OUZ54_13850 [Mycobacterium avium subsp. paratuberculosis]|nr:hypothetical protein OUZ54_13850 [Mycobacterium avium subsp. paratuberculosis]
MDYWVYPWPVDIVNEASAWAWLGPVLGLVGSGVLFVGGLVGVWCTNRNADKRHREQLDTTRAEGRADRAAERNDRLREEVANLLGERWATDKAAYKLATAADEYKTDRQRPEVSANERFNKALQVRDEHTPQFNKVEQLAIRAWLLTTDAGISSTLDAIRTVAQLWKDLVDSDPIETYTEIRDRLNKDFGRLEVLTRQLVTSDGAA